MINFVRFFVFFLIFFISSCGPRQIYTLPAVQETIKKEIKKGTGHSSDICINIPFLEPTVNPKNFQIPSALRTGLIVIDPGHGGEDNGTKSLVKPLYLEKFFNLTTAKFLASYLEQMGYQILLTRTDDTFIPLKERAQFANERRPLLFVSVHYNSAPSKEAQGVEVFYFKSSENPSRTESSRKLASAILNEVLHTTEANSRGVKQGNFAVIRETDMPAVLVEGGFLSHPEELEKLKDPCYLKKVAWGIAQGINRYLSTMPPKKSY